MAYPNFFIIGAPKCGTTSIADWLRGHPEVFLPKQKEPHHFNKDHSFNVYESYEDYIDLFSSGSGAKAVGEASVWYLYSEVAVEEIEEKYSGPKYIVCLRNPVEMAHSLYWEQVYATNEHIKTFDEAWKLSPKRRLGEAVVAHCREPKHLDYMYACRLGSQVEKLLNRVPRNRVKFVFLEDLQHRSEDVYKELQVFLEVSLHELSDYKASNTFKMVRWRYLKKLVRYLGVFRKRLPIKARFGVLNYLNNINKKVSEKPAINRELESEMCRYFQEDVKKLSEITNKNLDSWLR